MLDDELLFELIGECTSPRGLSRQRFEFACRYLGHELGTGPSDGLNAEFESLLARNRLREAACLIVPEDWTVQLVRTPEKRSIARISIPARQFPVHTTAIDDASAIIGTLLTVLAVGPDR